ncbi:MAG: glycosyltransferase family 2 protein [Endomicrobium sp.]|jgi:glycosyltransferase involved in cell wall biosynthesis|nr:glycosyltransferase family 2 protein [Endomicrobium sp.]
MTKELSVFIITKNEEANIETCLKSVQHMADEIIVVDSGSTDKTLEIAEKYGAVVYTQNFTSFTEQKNFALSKATGKWVLNLDADEALSPALQEEIKAIINSTDKSGFWIPVNNEFLGREMRHSGLHRQLRLRMAKRENASYIGGKVHESLHISGPIGILKNVIIHRPYKTIKQYFLKFNFYTSLAAETMYEENKKLSHLQLLRPPFEFFKLYILRLGILDGLEGFLWAYFSANYSFVKYAKLWNLQKNKGK